jgi:hypothetical protein
MSALPCRADVALTLGEVCEGPIADITRSPRPRERALSGNYEAQLFDYLEIDYQLKLRRGMDRKIARPFSSKNAIDVNGSSAERLDRIVAISQQPA